LGPTFELPSALELFLVDNETPSKPEHNALLDVFRALPHPKPPSDDRDNKESKRSPAFPSDRFLTKWFRERGKIYYFLFRKNHRVTNIQVAELLALVRTYAQGSSGELHFLSVAAFKEAIARIIESFDQSDATRYDFVANQYYEVIKNTAALDVMFGSCLLYLPPGIDVNIDTICSRSGYVHSCGPCVYVRNIYKATKQEMFGYIDSYLKPGGGRCVLRPYSHEDFTKHDRDQSDDLMSGLDDVKLYADKYFLEGERLSAVFEELRVKFSGRLFIPSRGNYKRDDILIDNEVKRGDFDRSHALFVVMDHSLDRRHRGKGDRHFIICYDQQCINDSPFHLFDENKPAWVDHTTMPQTLAGAMINITRPFWPSNDRVRISDFFVGSGTTWLEAIKHDDVDCCGVDIEPISALLLEDNLRFFSATPAEVDEYCWSLERVNNSLYQGKSDDNAHSPADEEAWRLSHVCQAYEKAMGFVDQLKNQTNDGVVFTKQLVDRLRNDSDPLTRLMFYTILKSLRRFEAAIQARSMSKNAALALEIPTLTAQLKRLASLKRRASFAIEKQTHRIKFQGTYSAALTVNDEYLRELIPKAASSIRIADCTKQAVSPRFDVIVTDPPYGFNTNEDRKNLAIVYASALRVMIGALRNGGQLVLAVPDWSHTGRQLPAFALRDFVTHQVLVTAEAIGKEVIHSASQAPSEASDAPYYWESEKALRRAILHFRFRDLPKYKRIVDSYHLEPRQTSSVD
jgi:tRNA G10  N-methylase Trm11